MPASVFQRLRNLARERGEDVNALLAQYAVERLLYRISRSSQSDRFVLKGAMLFRAWTGSLHRPMQDVDLLGYGDPEPDRIAESFAAILREVTDESDGLVFDDAAVIAEEIRGAQEYGGVRVRVPATLGTARVVVQVDLPPSLSPQCMRVQGLPLPAAGPPGAERRAGLGRRSGMRSAISY